MVECPLDGHKMWDIYISVMGDTFVSYECPKCKQLFELVSSKWREEVENKLKIISRISKGE